MSTRISRWMLITLALAIMAPRNAVAQAQSETSAQTYPGRYAANCKPAGNSCACDADAQNIHDPEYLRMIEWLLQTCTSLMQSERRPLDKALSDVTVSLRSSTEISFNPAWAAGVQFNQLRIVPTTAFLTEE